MTAIPFEGRYNRENLEAGMELINRATWRRQWAVIGGAMAVGLAFVIVIELVAGQLQGSGLLAAVLVLLAAVPFIKSRRRRAGRRAAGRILASPLGREVISGVATDDELETRTSQTAGTTRWSAYLSYAMDERSVVLFEQRMLGRILPRSFFATADDWEAFCQLVRTRVPALPVRKGSR